MSNLWCIETTIMVESPGAENEKSSSLGAGEPYQTPHTKPGDLFRDCVKAHGRCMGFMMVDDLSGKSPYRIGWTFRRRPTKEEISQNVGSIFRFVIETWVEVFSDPPRRIWTPGKHAKIG